MSFSDEKLDRKEIDHYFNFLSKLHNDPSLNYLIQEYPELISTFEVQSCKFYLTNIL